MCFSTSLQYDWWYCYYENAIIWGSYYGASSFSSRHFGGSGIQIDFFLGHFRILWFKNCGDISAARKAVEKTSLKCSRTSKEFQVSCPVCSGQLCSLIVTDRSRIGFTTTPSEFFWKIVSFYSALVIGGCSTLLPRKVEFCWVAFIVQLKIWKKITRTRVVMSLTL